MRAARSAANAYRPLLILGTIVLVVAALYWAQKILIPLALAILLAFILSPAVLALQKRGLGRIFSVLLVVILAFVILGGVGLAISFQIKSLAKELSERRHQLADKISSVLGAGKGTFLESFQKSVQSITHEVLENQKGSAGNEGANESAADSAEADKAPEPVPVRIIPSGYSQLREALGPAAEFLGTAGMVVVLVIFGLIKREDLRNRMVRLAGGGRLLVTTRATDEAAHRISRYLFMQLLINACFGATLTVGLFLIGVPYALLWGFLTGVLRFVPYVGTLLGATLLLGFSIAISDGWTQPLLVLGLFAGAEVLAFNVAEPLLFGQSTGISSVALVVAAAFWTWLWGPIGLVLSTPLTACLVVLGKYVPQLEFFSILLGDEPALDAQQTYYQRLLAHDRDEVTGLVKNRLRAHPAETIYDDVLIPALVLAKQDRQRHQLSAEDEQFVLQVTKEVLTDLVPHQKAPDSAPDAVPVAGDESTKALLFTCPARDAEDELACSMFQMLLEAANCRVEVFSAQMLSGELVARAEREHPTLVCIAALPPRGVARARHLCQCLRRHFPDLKILVGCWSQTEHIEKIRERLRAVGANGVGTTLLETRGQAILLIQSVANLRIDSPRNGPLMEATIYRAE